jgi:hypothetical protein
MRVYADDFRKTGDRNAAVLARQPSADSGPDPNLTWDLTWRTIAAGRGNASTPKAASERLSREADDGTRTHDLLHGNARGPE